MSLLWGPLAALALSACGAAGPADPDTAEQAVTAPAPDTCSAAGMDGDVCSGSWQYPTRCCATGYTAFNTCAHTHRSGNWTYAEAGTLLSPGGCYNDCTDYWGRIKCVKVCDPPSYSCQNAINNALASANATLNGCVKDPRVAWPAPQVVGSSVSGSTCYITVSNAAVSDAGQANACTTSADGICDGVAGAEVYGACAGPQPAAPGRTGTVNPDGSWEKQVVASPSTAQCGNLYRLSAVGKTQAQLAQEPVAPLSSTWVTADNAPRCLTCEPHSRLGATPQPTELQGKFDCMIASVASLPAAKDDALKRALTARGELFFEYYGDRLRPSDQLPRAEALYASYSPPVVPSCGQDPHFALPAPAAAGCGATASVDGALRRCDRLRDAHVPAAVAASEAASCTSAWDAVAALAGACSTRSTYQAGWADISTEVLRKGFSSLTDLAAADRKAKLQSRMATTETWYRDLQAAGEPTSQLFRDGEIVAGALVQGAYGNRLAQLDALSLAADPTQLQARDNLILGSSADDQEVLNALLTPAAGATARPLKNAPALWVMSHALQATSRRLSEMDFLHDLGCTFRGCAGLSTIVSQMHGVLGAIPTAAALRAAPGGLLSPGWQSVFTTLASDAAHAEVLEAAVADALGKPYAPALLTGAGPDDGPVYALAALVNDSAAKSDHYGKTGRLRSGDADALYASLLYAKLDDAVRQVDAAKTDLHNERVNFDGQWVTYLDQLVALTRGGDQLGAATSELTQKWELLRQYMTQLDGLRAAASVDQDRFGDFGKAYDAAIARLEKADARQYVQRAGGQVMPITPSDARYAAPFTNPSEVAVLVNGAPWKTSASRNDLVRIETTGQWSATCAIDAYAKAPQTLSSWLQARRQQNPITPTLENYTGAKTGPQGYGVVYSNSTYSGRTTSDPDFNPLNYTAQAGAAIGMIAGGPVGAAVGGFVGSVFGGLLGGGSSSASTGGSDFRATAAFSAGLRVPTAPYPQYPAGALLAVKANPATGAFVDAEVVQSPSTTIVVDAATDLYLVVNDATCARTVNPANGQPVDVGGLSVQVTTLTPVAGYALQVQPAMAAAYTYVQTQIQTKLLPQQMILPSDLPTIRSQALDDLAQACNYCTLSAFDGNMMGFFTAFVDTALNQAERQVEMGRLDRQIRLLTMEWAALEQHVEALQRQSQLLALLPAWSANNLDEDRLRWRTEALVEVVERDLSPFVRARYPEVLAGGPGLTGLHATPTVFDPITVNLDWTRNWGAVAEDAINVVGQIEGKVLAARSLYDQVVPPPGSGPVTMTVGVAVPKPESMYTPDMAALASINYTKRFRELAPEQSAAVWDAIRGGRPGRVHIPVEALFRGASEPNYAGQLDCTRTTPVIQSMAIYAIDDGNSANATLNTEPGHTVPLYASDHLAYATPDGPAEFNGMNPAWLNFSARILYGVESSALDYYSRYPSDKPAALAGAGQGLSPFGRFTLGVDPAQLDRPSVYALVFLMTVEYRNSSSATQPRWIASCR